MHYIIAKANSERCTLAEIRPALSGGTELIYTPFDSIQELGDYCTAHEIFIPIERYMPTMRDFTSGVLHKRIKQIIHQ